MGKNYLLKSSLVLALLMAFCIKVLSQGTDNIPKEGSMFYMDDRGVSTNKASTRWDNNSLWSFKSVIENCFDSTMVDKDAWMMTADGETKLKVTFEYKTDDERYKIESSEIEFCFYDGPDLFSDGNAELIDDARITGTFTKEETEKSVTLHMTAPKVFPDPDLSWYKFYVVVYLKFKEKGTAAVARQIGVSRNGLLLMHGLNSNRQCFWPFGEYLYNTGSYLKQQFYIQDYSSSNTSSFYDNTHVNRVVENGLKTLSKKLFDIGIASTKYDMIGHSMGGILERLYNQEIDNEHTNKLITLNTPHYGSQLGDYFIELEEAQKDPLLKNNEVAQCFSDLFDRGKKITFQDDTSRQAVKDLATRSEAIQSLGNRASELKGIRVCAVGTEIDWSIATKMGQATVENYYQAYCYLSYHIFGKEVKQGRRFLGPLTRKSDAVVTVESQIGGCEKSYIYKGSFDQANHCKSTEWSEVHDQLRYLLTEANTADFSINGFGTPPAKTRTRDSDNEYEFVTEFETPKPTSFIKIEAKVSDDPNYTHEINLTHSDDMMTTMAFCILSMDDVIYDLDNDVMYFDMSGFEGEKWIYAVGRTNYNALVIDSVKVSLGGSGEVDGIKSVENEPELRYSVMGNSLKIKNVTGPYSVAIYNYAGQMLTEMKSNPSHTYALPGNKGLLIVSVRSNKGKQFLKVMTK